MNTKTLFFGVAFALASSTLVAGVANAEPQSYPGHRGYGSSRPCPYNCKSAGIPADKCREWRTGNTCYIEDFTRAPRTIPQPTPVQAKPLDTDGILGNNERPNPAIDYNHRPSAPPPFMPPTNHAPTNNGGSGYQECRALGSYDMGQPRVDVGQTKPTGNLFGDKYKLRGSVEGVCLVEAGLFEHGRKVSDIPVNTLREFRRFEFEVKASMGDEPEIRVYNINGDRDVYRVSGE